MYKVYIYTFPNGKVYIGMTKNTLAERRDMGYQHNKELQKTIREFGWQNFKHEIIKDGLTKSQAEELEIETIEKYKATDPEKVLNISKGGTATFEGLSHTEEYKERMRRLNTGKKFSKEHLQNIKIAREKTSTKVTGTDADGNKTEYKSLHDAAEKVGGFATNISRAIKSGKNYKGFSWAESERKGVV